MGTKLFLNCLSCFFEWWNLFSFCTHHGTVTFLPQVLPNFGRAFYIESNGVFRPPRVGEVCCKRPQLANSLQIGGQLCFAGVDHTRLCQEKPA